MEATSSSSPPPLAEYGEPSIQTKDPQKVLWRPTNGNDSGKEKIGFWDLYLYETKVHIFFSE